ncbi:o-succinylbenzoate synthase [Vibrio mangrovi]|uniref:o-succinylbenzoate synthase n=1 Tax=Vibrio mangrovi TaxID=474394 RepID=A0A1Y6IPS7_9VIBR|nr:o-succinylbenzoate synthase [Vibrio mangrovi]MDW6003552.1 o-succinylbenzoate synthase [Vibrio mangrovi]SMR99655.1 o-succinylbenzoate synthase [Vibrio mangrovi]
MRSAKLYRYRLPMDSGVILRNEKLFEREGFIVEMHDRDQAGRGEIAPLIGFSEESVTEAGIQLQEQLALWCRGEAIDYQHLYPSVAFGLSAAQAELSGELPQEGNYFAAPLCVGDPDELIERLQVLPGKKVAKVKVGMYEPVRDGLVINLLLESIPDLSLRLDVNREWTPEKAAIFASKISPSYRQRIAYVEEPCASPSDSIAFAINTGIAIAWDETLQASLKDPDFRLEELTGVKALIIKPTLIGSIERCRYLVEKAQSLGMQPVISSSIESSFGLCQLARLSRWLLPEEVPGLDTVGLFRQQLAVAWPGCDIPVVELNSQEVIWAS